MTISEQPQTQEEVFAHCAYTGQREAVEGLLNQGIHVHYNDDAALRNAASAGRTDIVQLLLDREANIHAADDYALRWAIKIDHAPTVELLLARGANAKAADNDPILQAVQKSTAVLKLVIEHGADVHYHGEAPLQLALENDRLENAKLLLEHGANLHHDSDRLLRRILRTGSRQAALFALQNAGVLELEPAKELAQWTALSHPGTAALWLANVITQIREQQPMPTR